MRKPYFLIPVLCIILPGTFVNAQLVQPGPSLSHTPSKQGPPVSPRDVSAFQQIVNINGEDGFYVKKNLYLNDLTTYVNGQNVLGTPFLFYEWSNGYITTPDNRNYDTYKLRYDVYNQTVSFLNGKDSLDVNEAIREFVLRISVGDSLVSLKFVNSDQYKKEKNTFYYEVLLDNDRGQLLKTNKKVITSENKDGLMSTQGKKYFNLVFTYYYFDKATKKITKIEPDGSNIAAILGVTAEGAKELELSGFDFSKEQDIIRLIKKYSQKTKAKSF